MNLVNETEKYIFSTYKRFPIVLVKGKGSRVWDQDGKEYLDFVSGLAVCSLGHCHPKVVEAIEVQAKNLLHVSNLFHTKPQIELARLLVENSFADKVFFCNSGAEANEGAIKLSRKYMRDKKEDRFEIIAMRNSFHGRTLATITATGQEKFKEGFDPLMPGFTHVPFDNMDAVQRAVTEKTTAIMVEPIQGEGGVNCPSDSYLKELRAFCDEKKLLLIFDEIQVGLGRTGKLFAYEHYGITPDIMTLAKALAGGLPIGALLARDEIAKSFIPGTHASTFGGNPLVTAAGIAAFTALKDPALLGNCSSMGAYFMDELNQLKKKHPVIREVRGKGLIIAMELTMPGAEIVNKCLQKGVLINCVQNNVLRFLPPLIVTKEEVDHVVALLDEVLTS
ncbi:MAG: acetylornithine transaminase [Thermodesulfobacteriota bacterium]|jgi:predicted acetylornithine/succinylornithine family transaminase|nr:MAG: acetylornithine transaminase [Thermodesulfobacteriota bacterium]